MSANWKPTRLVALRGRCGWAMIETAWRVVGKTRRCGQIYKKLRARIGGT